MGGCTIIESKYRMSKKIMVSYRTCTTLNSHYYLCTTLFVFIKIIFTVITRELDSSQSSLHLMTWFLLSQIGWQCQGVRQSETGVWGMGPDSSGLATGYYCSQCHSGHSAASCLPPLHCHWPDQYQSCLATTPPPLHTTAVLTVAPTRPLLSPITPQHRMIHF